MVDADVGPMLGPDWATTSGPHSWNGLYIHKIRLALDGPGPAYAKRTYNNGAEHFPKFGPSIIKDYHPSMPTLLDRTIKSSSRIHQSKLKIIIHLNV